MSLSQSAPLWYQPTDAEVSAVAASAARRHPALASRIDKAADILRSGALQLDDVAWDLRNVVRWRVASQSGNGIYVVVNHGCPCQDRRTQYCKHSIAVSLYSKIVTNRFNADIRARQIDLGILPDGSFNAYASKMGIVHACKIGTGYGFCDSASMVRHSIWTAQQPVAIEQWPVAVAVAA